MPATIHTIARTAVSSVLTVLTAMAATLLPAACGSGVSELTTHLHPGVLPDTLRVATLYSPTSYFIYREEPMGYDYGLVSRFAADKGMTLDLVIAHNLTSMIEMLDSGKVDLIAYDIPVTAEYKKSVLACGPENETYQVLVQPRKSGVELITDVTQLVGRDVYVENNSKYMYRMLNLNDELGGGINIHSIDRDTLITEELIEMVSDGSIPLTVVDSDIARLNKTYYRDLDITLKLSFAQRSSWGVTPANSWLADTIDTWLSQEQPRNTQAQLLKRYFELSKNELSIYTIDLSHGRISPYDDTFRRYAATAGTDWRLLAAQGFIESKFDSTVVSWAGARGIMQIMPVTARAYGHTPEEIVHPETGIATAAKIMRDLDRSLAKTVKDSIERRKFVIGAYNSGVAHIYDAIALAQKYGYDQTVWDGNVATALLMKANPEYYNDPVCRFGYFRGRQTITYVRHVMEFYERCKQNIPQ